jgi:hypothetical protein
MNEHIRELAREAGYYLYDLTETHQTKTVETDEKDEWIILERFAELIVRECSQIVADAVDHREPASTYADKIKKHFEIK